MNKNELRNLNIVSHFNPVWWWDLFTYGWISEVLVAHGLCLWWFDVCLSQAKFHENKDISKQLPDFGLWLTNIRRGLLFLIRTHIGLFLMQMIVSNSTLSNNSAKDWFWLYGVARKHPSLNVGKVTSPLQCRFFRMMDIKF